jgi:hypothetical protein
VDDGFAHIAYIDSVSGLSRHVELQLQAAFVAQQNCGELATAFAAARSALK